MSVIFSGTSEIFRIENSDIFISNSEFFIYSSIHGIASSIVLTIEIGTFSTSSMITYILNPDYSVFGIFMIFAFYYLKSNDIYKIAVIAIMNFYAVWWGHQAYATLALIPIYLYKKHLQCIQMKIP